MFMLKHIFIKGKKTIYKTKRPNFFTDSNLKSLDHSDDHKNIFPHNNNVHTTKLFIHVEET